MDSETPVLEAPFVPNMTENLSLSRNFLIKSVSNLLENARYAHAERLIQAIRSVDEVLNDRQLMATHEDSVLTQIEIDMIKSGQKINAIKEVRTRTGLGLKEAKDLVESYKQP